MLGQVLTVLASMVGAFFAAWIGAYVGFRRTKMERALDRRVEWHERAIESLISYENCLEDLHKDSRNTLLVRARVDEGPEQHEDVRDPEEGRIARTFHPEPSVWEQVSNAELKARAALRWADMYTEGIVRIRCSAALSSSVNLVSGHWFDVSPSPEIPWADLHIRSSQVSSLRRALQESLRVVLELDGWFTALRGEAYRKRRELRELEKVRDMLSKPSRGDGDQSPNERDVV